MSYRNEGKPLLGKALAKVAMDGQEVRGGQRGAASGKGRRAAALCAGKGEGRRKVQQVKGICWGQVGIRAYLCVRQTPADGKPRAAFLR